MVTISPIPLPPCSPPSSPPSLAKLLNPIKQSLASILKTQDEKLKALEASFQTELQHLMDPDSTTPQTTPPSSLDNKTYNNSPLPPSC